MSSTFSDLGVRADLVSALAKRQITEPFPIQAATIPDALAGRDICGRAPTGSGKTLAFGLPMLARVERAPRLRPHALVLVPTRELAAQIQRELKPLASIVGRRIISVYGGVGYEPQRRELRRGVDILVACPGRLNDLVEQGAVILDAVRILVIDEADRMADMGFMPQIRTLLELVPKDRQTILFSATLDGDTAALTRQYQHDAARHEVGDIEPDVTSATHEFWHVEAPDRSRHTATLINAHGPTIVFCRTRHGADRLVKQLGAAGVTAAPIHGGRSQSQRDRALQSFKQRGVDALVATDVAARGIHVDGVACVVHFDLAEDAKAYLHRSGRTARAGATGVVVTLVPDGQTRAVRTLQSDIGLPVGLERVHLDGRRKAEVVKEVPHTSARPPRSRPARSGRESGMRKPRGGARTRSKGGS